MDLNERKARALQWIEDQGATITIHFDEVNQICSDEGGWLIEDIINNSFRGKSLLEAVENAMYQPESSSSEALNKEILNGLNF